MSNHTKEGLITILKNNYLTIAIIGLVGMYVSSTSPNLPDVPGMLTLRDTGYVILAGCIVGLLLGSKAFGATIPSTFHQRCTAFSGVVGVSLMCAGLGALLLLVFKTGEMIIHEMPVYLFNIGLAWFLVYFLAKNTINKRISNPEL